MTDVAYACPKCGSPSVSFSSLEGGEAACKPCGWLGVRGDLLAMPFNNDYGSQDAIFSTLTQEWKQIFGKFSIDVGRFLVHWGFLVVKPGQQKVAATALARYLAAMATASLTAVLQEREKFEKERINAG